MTISFYIQQDGTYVQCSIIAKGQDKSLIVCHGRANEKTCIYVENERIAYHGNNPLTSRG